MFRIIFLCAIFMANAALTANAEEIPAETDSLDIEELHEIVIEAPRVVHKTDMDVYYPSASAVENSKDGMQMLKNLMIPSITVNDFMNTLTAAGENVQIRINGRIASTDELTSLLPESIKRVEFIDNPGLRYGGATKVLNIIIQNPTVGGSVMAQVMPALNCAWGQYHASVKLNSGRSQWSLSGHFQPTNNIDIHREYEETFTFEDSSQLKRTETPIGGNLKYTYGNFRASYSYIIPDTTIIYASLNGFKQWSDDQCLKGRMSLSNGAEDILLTDGTDGSSFKPEATFYLEQHLARKQTIVVDANASLYNGFSGHTYIESSPDNSETFTDVRTDIKDRNQAYAIEANYIKEWPSSRLTTGASYTANRNRSVYKNLDNAVFHQRQDKVYFFGEYFQRIKNVTLTAGLGVQYSSFHQAESGQGQTSWNLRPQFKASYRFNNTSQFRFYLTSWQTTPSLTQTNDTPQQIDGFQYSVGNPNIKTSSTYCATLSYNYSKRRISSSFIAQAYLSPDAIAPYMIWDNGRLITSYENSDGWKSLRFKVMPQIEVIPDWLNVGLFLEYRIERAKGTGYLCRNHNWCGSINAMVSHWGFTLAGTYYKSPHELFGSSKQYGESLSIIELGYNLKNWGFAAGTLMPFGEYDRGSSSHNRLNTNTTHLRVDMTPMPYLRISYNLSWGHQKRDVQKLINADSEVQSSKAAGR